VDSRVARGDQGGKGWLKKIPLGTTEYINTIRSAGLIQKRI
jgi:hypothetical protein